MKADYLLKIWLLKPNQVSFIKLNFIFKDQDIIITNDRENMTKSIFLMDQLIKFIFKNNLANDEIENDDSAQWSTAECQQEKSVIQ